MFEKQEVSEEEKELLRRVKKREKKNRQRKVKEASFGTSENPSEPPKLDSLVDVVQLLLGKIEVLTETVAAMAKKVNRLEGIDVVGLDKKEIVNEIPGKVYKKVEDLGRKVEECEKSVGDKIQEYDRKLPNVIGSHVRNITRKEKDEDEEKIQKQELLRQQLRCEQRQQQEHQQRQLSELQQQVQVQEREIRLSQFDSAGYDFCIIGLDTSELPSDEGKHEEYVAEKLEKDLNIALGKEGMGDENDVYDCIKTFRLGGNYKANNSVPIFITTFQQGQRNKILKAAKHTPNLKYRLNNVFPRMLRLKAGVLRRKAAEIYKKENIFTRVVSLPDKHLGRIIMLQKRIQGQWTNELSEREIC